MTYYYNGKLKGGEKQLNKSFVLIANYATRVANKKTSPGGHIRKAPKVKTKKSEISLSSSSVCLFDYIVFENNLCSLIQNWVSNLP